MYIFPLIPQSAHHQTNKFSIHKTPSIFPSMMDIVFSFPCSPNIRHTKNKHCPGFFCDLTRVDLVYEFVSVTIQNGIALRQYMYNRGQDTYIICLPKLQLNSSFYFIYMRMVRKKRKSPLRKNYSECALRKIYISHHFQSLFVPSRRAFFVCFATWKMKSCVTEPHPKYPDEHTNTQPCVQRWTMFINRKPRKI